jgi:ubiquinone/menaquinone biosynthesis C-methylase UbiE
MISAGLRERVACPVCLEGGGCAACAVRGGHAETCARYRERAGCACGGADKVRLEDEGDALRCPCCGERYPVVTDGGYLDLVPRASVGRVTQYADHEFHERLHVTDAPPVLSARVKADMMRRMLDTPAGEPVLDLGCGAGKMALYAAARGGRAAGIDLAPFFLTRAARDIELVQGDLRRLPFRKGSFPRAYSLDVLEHLDEDGVKEVLTEARRTVGPAGRLFVYTHAMESSRLAQFQRAVNRLARRLGERGLIDHEREAMRKSDHVNAIRSHEHFDALCASAGLVVTERRYYNVVFKAVVEDLLLRLYEHRRRGPTAAKDGGAAHEGVENAHDHMGADAPPPGRLVLAIAQALTWVLKLDVVLFGGIRTGPFFGLLRPAPPRA